MLQSREKPCPFYKKTGFESNCYLMDELKREAHFMGPTGERGRQDKPPPLSALKWDRKARGGLFRGKMNGAATLNGLSILGPSRYAGLGGFRGNSGALDWKIEHEVCLALSFDIP